MIYDLLIVFSYLFMTAPMEMVALTTLRIYLMINLKDINNTYKICDKVSKKFKCLCKLIGCEAQAGTE